MAHDLVPLRAALLGVMGLAMAQPACVVDATIGPDTDADTDTDTDTDTDVDRTCDRAEEMTADRLDELANAWDEDPLPKWMVCGPLEPDGACSPVEELPIYRWLYEQLGEPPEPDYCGYSYSDTCGPEIAEPGRCCYVMDLAIICEGRALCVDGEAHTAPSVARADWRSTLQGLGVDLPAATRARAAEHWRVAASFEHASVASFARAALELMAFGAPPHLLAGVSAAMQDEVRHAADAYAVASELLGRPVGPGALPTHLAGPRPVEEVLRATILEGCLGETVAAARAGRAMVDCESALRPLVARVAHDEARHAALAWQTVQWLLARRPDLVEVAHQAFHEALEEPFVPSVAPVDPLLARVGCLSDRERVDVLRRVQRQVVGPCAQALLDSLSAPVA